MSKLTSALMNVYTCVATDPVFDCDYEANYRALCEKFSRVKDWHFATDEELHEIVCGECARRLAFLNWGEPTGDEWEIVDKQRCRTICAAIQDRSQLTNAYVEEQRMEFEPLWCKRRKAALYRIVAALHPSVVVQVPDVAKLAPLYEWLSGCSSERPYDGRWFELSSFVRCTLKRILPTLDVYQIGVLAWYLAEAFRPKLTGKAANRKRKILSILRCDRVLD